MNSRFYIIAGEASGDLHGSNLIRALRAQSSNCDIQFWGGDLMSQASEVSPRKHYKELAFMGFAEVIKHLPEIFRNLKYCKKDILNFKPDALILIDYPGFNLRIAKWAHNQGINVQYFISPKIWAWNTSRVHKIDQSVNNMYVILPFEKEFYAKYGYKVTYVGNPLLDEINQFVADDDFRAKNKLERKKIIAILPGSRKQELKNSLPTMVKMIKEFPDYHFCIAKVPTINRTYYDQLIQGINTNRLSFIQNDTYNLLVNSSMAIVTSGTATLEAALFNVPQVVCYKTSKLSYMIGKRLIKLDHISLVNLILDTDAVVELIQANFNSSKLASSLRRFNQPAYMDLTRSYYAQLHKILGSKGAAKLVAKGVIESLDKS